MRIVIAPDSFKESLTARHAAQAMACGLKAAGSAMDRSVDVRSMPISDGGEGFLTALLDPLGLQLENVPSLDALGRPMVATLGFRDDLAVFDVASAIGLERIRMDERDVANSSSRGVGHLIAAARRLGCRRFIVGLGGSATNDGGAGLLAELGVRFLDATGRELPPTPNGLRSLATVDLDGFDSGDTEWLVACDVDNPLLGATGATAVFGPQKGVSATQVADFDSALANYAAVTGFDPTQPGAGAAGGLGYAFAGFFSARLRPGIDIIADAIGLAEAVSSADLVLTGEGTIDEQTWRGKAPAGVIRLAQAAGVPVWVFGGRVQPGTTHAFAKVIEITEPSVPQAEALAEASANLTRAVANTFHEVFGTLP